MLGTASGQAQWTEPRTASLAQADSTGIVGWRVSTFLEELCWPKGIQKQTGVERDDFTSTEVTNPEIYTASDSLWQTGFFFFQIFFFKKYYHEHKLNIIEL